MNTMTVYELYWNISHMGWCLIALLVIWLSIKALK